VVNGCHNRAPLAETITVQDGWSSDGRRHMVDLPDPMTKACNYTHTTLGQADKECTGCRWKVEGKGNG
jgi:hypothetical protein